MSSVVLDASALIAFLRREPGSDAVAELLPAAAISTVNLSEVLAKAAESPIGNEQVRIALQGLPLRIVVFDEQQAIIAANFHPATRPFGLSLGDRCCLALGMVETGPVLTTDRIWGKLNLGIEIRVLR